MSTPTQQPPARESGELVERAYREGHYDGKHGSTVGISWLDSNAKHDAAHIEALTRRLEEAEGFIAKLIPVESSGTWMDAVGPLIERFTVAAKFDQEAVHNAEGSQAIAELMKVMAEKLDTASSEGRAALQALRRTGEGG